MATIGSGGAKPDTTPVLRAVTKSPQQPPVSRELDDALRAAVSNIGPRAPRAPDGTQQVKDMVAALTREPRAAIEGIEREIGALRDMLTVREQVLVEAIEQHAALSSEAVHGMGVVRQAIEQIRDAFHHAMRPMPMLEPPAKGSDAPGGDGGPIAAE
jgi:hypothetical protein